MAILNDQVRDQLRQRFEERLTGDVRMTLYLKPGSGRLILPTGVGCPTCEEARQLAEEIREAAPERIELEVVDVTALADAPVDAVPTLQVSAPGGDSRIAFQGLPAGYEFATVVDAVERVSRSEPGLSERTMERLALLEEEVEIMVFATPT